MNINKLFIPGFTSKKKTNEQEVTIDNFKDIVLSHLESKGIALPESTPGINILWFH